MSCPPRHRALCRRLGLEGDLPFVPDWSAEADFLELLVERVAGHGPACVLECGSGLSTLVLAAACRAAGSGRVISLDHEARFAGRTRRALRQHGLDAFAEVRHAPLRPVLEAEGGWRWYAPGRCPEGPIDLLVVDGPPGHLQPLSRYPALPLLADRLAPGARILLDDAARADERELVARWRARWPDAGYRWHPLARGCAELVWSAQTDAL